MKKNIGFVSLGSSLVNWLTNRLKEPTKDIAGKNDLLEAIENLSDGTYSSLILEFDGDSEKNTTSSYASGDIQCGTLSISARSRKVTRDNVTISLTPKEFDILYFLASNQGEVFTKQQIYQAVWEDDYLMDDSNIMAFIRKLRKKIEPNPDEPEYIQTIWGIGYKFKEKP